MNIAKRIFIMAFFVVKKILVTNKASNSGYIMIKKGQETPQKKFRVLLPGPGSPDYAAKR
jgi:hypothetical protein